jgi:hypothetical protein
MTRTWPALLMLACVQPVQVLGDGDAGTDAGPLVFGLPRELFPAGDPFLTDDELELFASDSNIVAARRASTTEAWGPLVLIEELASDATETDPSVSLDGLTMIFTSYRDGGEGDLYYSERAARGGTWSAPIRIAELSSPYPDCCAVQNAARTVVLFASERSGNMDIYRAERADPSQPWSTPVVVPELTTTSFHELPSQWRGDRLVFDSDRAMRGRDVYIARYGPGGLLSLQAIDSVNSTGDDRNAWLSVDERRIYFQSDRSGQQVVYVADH